MASDVEKNKNKQWKGKTEFFDTYFSGVGVAQVVEYLSRKHKALGSNSSTRKKKIYFFLPFLK
jgi:hypothetical protein